VTAVHPSATLAFSAWLLWTAWVALYYYGRPGELLVVFETPLRAFPFWREAMAGHARALGGAALVALAAWGLGSWVMALVASRRSAGTAPASPVQPLPLRPAEQLLLTLAVGTAALGFVFFLLALLHLYRPWMTTAVVVVAAGGGVAALARSRWPRPRAVVWRVSDWVFAGCALLGVGAALAGALAPESEYDALWYHLWLPARWLAAGRALDIVEEYVSLYPIAWDLVGGAAMVVGGPVAAKLLHFGCLPLAGLTAWLISQRLFPEARPILAAALAIVTPITIWEATTAYVDLALAWYVAVGTYALIRYLETRDGRWLILSSLVAGGGLATKHLGLVAFAILACGLALGEWRASERLGRAVRVLFLFAAVALILPSGWYARAYAASGNPVFPDLYGVFGARPPERWSPATERGLQGFKDRFGRERTVRHLLLLPWDGTVNGARYGGTIGPLFLILVPAAVIGPRARRTAWAVAAGCAAYVAVWASPISSFQMRFLVPIVPILAVLGAEGAARIERAAMRAGPRARGLMLGSLVVLLLFNLPPTSGWHEPHRRDWDGWMTHIVRAMPLGVVLGAESREDYLARTVPSYRAWRFIDTALPSDVLVLTFSGGDHLYSTRPRIWSEATLARPATWGSPAGQERAALDALAALDVSHVLFDRRQLEDGTVSALAIGSETMRRCCLTLEYGDERFALYRVVDDREGASPVSEADAASSATGSTRHVCGTWTCPSTCTPGSTWSVVLPSHQAITSRLDPSRATAVRQYAPGRSGSAGQVNSTIPPGGPSATGVSVSVRAMRVRPSAV
jgi:4-amino-4-deoxy-L-arabinose transferase-like glycosyltransferase